MPDLSLLKPLATEGVSLHTGLDDFVSDKFKEILLLDDADDRERQLLILAGMSSILLNQGKLHSAGLPGRALIEAGKARNHYYTVPRSQVPYLLSISLDQIQTRDLAIPEGCRVVKFAFDNSFHWRTVTLARIEIKQLADVGAGQFWHCQVGSGSKYFHTSFKMGTDRSLLDELLDTEKKMKDGGFPAVDWHEVEKLLSMIANALMLHRCKPEFFLPDVLAADREKYAQAVKEGDNTSMDAIVSRARRRKGHGLIFDTGENWDIDLGHVGKSDVDYMRGGGTERTRCWIRRGHWRRVAHGPGHEYRKWHFFPPQLCRPDLASSGVAAGA